MGSTNTTANLNLSSWTETDKPQRIDFVNDNNIIDSVLGGHISDSIAHVTANDKQKIKKQIVVTTYLGTGRNTQIIPLTITPRIALTFRMGEPLCKTDESGVNIIYGGVATTSGSSGGLTLSGNTLTVSQTSDIATPGTGACLYCQNEMSVRYVLIMVQDVSFDSDSNSSST